MWIYALKKPGAMKLNFPLVKLDSLFKEKKNINKTQYLQVRSEACIWANPKLN